MVAPADAPVPTVMSTAIVWFRRDLRVHDHPALTAAHREADRVVPALRARPAAARRRAVPLAQPRRGSCSSRCASCAARCATAGASCSSAPGGPSDVLPALAREVGAETVHFASDVSPFAMARDRRVTAALDGVAAVRRHPGNFVADVGKPTTKQGRPFVVFSPFWRAWEQLPRRDVHGAPRALQRAVRRSPPATDPGRAGARGHRAVPARRGGRARAPLGLALRRDRALRRPPRPGGGRHVAALALPALRLRLGARGRGAGARQGRPRERRVRAPARVARLLRPRPAPSPGQRGARVQGGVRGARVGRRTTSALAAWQEGRTGYPGRRRRDAPARCTRAGCTTARG